MSEAPTYDIEIEQGTNWSEIIRFRDADRELIDLSGHAFSCPVKRTTEPTAPVEFELTVTLIPEVVEGVTKNLSFKLSVTPETTLDLQLGAKGSDSQSRFRYNLDSIDPLGETIRWFKGEVFIYRAVKGTA